MGPSGGVEMEGNAHAPAIFLSLLVELIELSFANFCVIVHLVIAPVKGASFISEV